MAYNEDLAYRIRSVLGLQDSVTERKMFGGLVFMVNGHMCCGVTGDELMVRVGPEMYADALAMPHARVMDFTGKVSRNTVYVDEAGVANDGELAAWIGRGLAYVATLPPKN